ncbi:MAG TPA: ATP-binding protein [Chthonomonadaceae bacterium]|nr:ATP-binding protein [Chthonomonadaceae bacterium]
MKTLIPLFALLILPCFANSQHAMPETRQPSITLMPGLGHLHHAVSTRNAEAQRFFDQGLTLVYAFHHEAVGRSFQRAAELDPQLAMAYWGIALALGPNINLDIDADREKQAAEAIQKAQSRAAHASEPERAYIAALATRYSSDPKADLQQLAVNYKNAMGDLVKRYPDDLDAATLYAESLMDLRPWKLWTSDGKPAEGTEEIVSVLESVLRRDPHHIGANHYYIHAVEASPHPERALACAKRLEGLAPGAGHLVHMPAHIYIRIGDYDGAARANERAVAVDRAYLEHSGFNGIYPMYYLHNLDFLQIAYGMEGRFQDASRAVGQLAANGGPMVKQMPAMFEYAMAKPLLVLERFRRWDDILQTPAPDVSLPVTNAIWRYERGTGLCGAGPGERRGGGAEGVCGGGKTGLCRCRLGPQPRRQRPRHRGGHSRRPHRVGAYGPTGRHRSAEEGRRGGGRVELRRAAGLVSGPRNPRRHALAGRRRRERRTGLPRGSHPEPAQSALSLRPGGEPEGSGQKSGGRQSPARVRPCLAQGRCPTDGRRLITRLSFENRFCFSLKPNRQDKGREGSNTDLAVTHRDVVSVIQEDARDVIMAASSGSPQKDRDPFVAAGTQNEALETLSPAEEGPESVYARNMEVVRNAVMKAARLVNARGLLVLVARPDQGALVALDCSYGFNVNDYSTIFWPLHGGILARVFSEQRPQILSAPSTDPDEFFILTRPNIKNAAVVPLSYTWKSEGKLDRIETVGVLIAVGKHRSSGATEEFTEEDIDILAKSSARISSLLSYTDLYSVTSEAVHQFRLSIQSLRSGFLSINDQGIIYEMNRAAEQILGMPNVQGEHYEKVFTEKLDFLKTRVKRIFSSGTSESSEIEIDIPNEEGGKSHKKYRIQLDPVYAYASNTRSEVTGVVILLTDVPSANEQTLAEVMGTMVHDLRAPLTVIMGYAETALDLDDNEFNKEALKNTYLQSRRMKRIASDLLDISSLIAGHSLTIEKKPCDVREILTGLIEDNRVINTKPLVLYDDLDYRTDTTEIVSDKDRIASVCQNFLTNAWKYSPEDRENHIRVVVTEEGDFLRIAVADQGMGIPRDQQARMFKPYFRVQSQEHAKVKGTGLGLYLCRSLVEALGGTIGLESEWKQGSTFFFTVPV